MNDDTEQAAARLHSELRALHSAAADPSSRVLAGRIGDVSHTTIAQILQGKRLPRPRTLEQLVAELGGDVDYFSDLLLRATGVSPGKNLGRSDRRARIVEIYKALVRSEQDRLFLAGSASSMNWKLADLMVDPTFRSTLSTDDKVVHGVEELAGSEQRVLLLGDPGSGKSTVCQALMVHFASPRSPVIPFYVSARELARSSESSESSIREYVIKRLRSIYQLDAEVEQLIPDLGRSTVFLFDGLDEIWDVQTRRHVAAAIESFSLLYREARVFVTSRTIGFIEVELYFTGFAKYSLLPFSQSQISDYLDRRQAIHGTQASRLTSEQIGRLFSANEQERLLGLAANPLLLSTIVNIAEERPFGNVESEFDLLQSFSELLISRWDSVRGIRSSSIPVSLVLDVLQELGTYSEAHDARQMAELELLEQVEIAVTKRYSSIDLISEVARRVVVELTERNWMLSETEATTSGGRLYAFTSRSLGQYWAAVNLIRHAYNPEQLAGKIADNLRMSSAAQGVARLALEGASNSFGQGAEKTVRALMEEVSVRPLTEARAILILIDTVRALWDSNPDLVRSREELSSVLGCE